MLLIYVIHMLLEPPKLEYHTKMGSRILIPLKHLEEANTTTPMGRYPQSKINMIPTDKDPLKMNSQAKAKNIQKWIYHE